jgi:hypothetical protein
MILFSLGFTIGIIITTLVFAFNMKEIEMNHGLKVDIRPRTIRTNGKHKPIMYTDKKAIELEQ